MAKTLNHPPFPTLTYNGYFWDTDDDLPAWSGFQDHSGPYGSSTGDAPSTGRCHISVKPAGSTADPPTPEQVAAYEFFKANDIAIRDAALQAIYELYPKWQESYGYDEDEAEESAEMMPNLTSVNDLKPLIGLNTVHILNVARDGVAYFGLELECTWDDEHGVGVMLHKSRIIKVGGADTSFQEWVAKADLPAS